MPMTWKEIIEGIVGFVILLVVVALLWKLYFWMLPIFGPDQSGLFGFGR